ncbi:MAG: excinuclease ABC subunit A, partial [Chitinophagia bacterium]|nr:excinuclease ABC subunit A [Chitinophagia bacterium]
QRRYVESLSAYARQFLERMDKPEVDEVVGICPAIAISQKNTTRNPRSTVATQTEIYDYLRLLFARIGETSCRRCGSRVQRDTPQSITEQALAWPEGTRFYVLFPATAGMETAGALPEEATESTAAKSKSKPAAPKKRKKTGSSPEISSRIHLQAHLMSLMQRGLTRLYHAPTETILELQSPDSFVAESFDNYFVLVDRLVVRPDLANRLVDSLEVCFQEGHGQVVLRTVGSTSEEHWFSEKYECKGCGLEYLPPEPRLFSFNNPYGACPTCQGFGNTIGVDLSLVIPDRTLSLEEGAIEPFTKPQFEWWRGELKKFARRRGISMSAPFEELSQSEQRLIIHGEDDTPSAFPGVLGLFDWLETKKYKLHVRVLIAKYRGYTICGTCQGGRL